MIGPRLIQLAHCPDCSKISGKVDNLDEDWGKHMKHVILHRLGRHRGDRSYKME